jgi:prepilin-type N-terminal cleavage/methylation domain-containing protein
MSRQACNRGISLVELLIVVVILGIAAAVAVPNLSPTDSYKLDLAAGEVAEAIRYARSEAIRTGAVTYLSISQVTQQITLGMADLSASPVAVASVLIHPLSKKNYDFNLSDLPVASGVRITNSDDVFLYSTVGRAQSLLFDATGTPKWMAGGTSYRLSSGEIRLGYADQEKIVRIAPLTGRVTIQ